MPTLYALRVLHAERSSSGASTSAAPRAENLYVRVKLGEDQPKTKLQDGAAPTWNETLSLSSGTGSEDEILLIELKQRLYLRKSRCLGSVKASLSDLMSKSVDGEVMLNLQPTEKSVSLTVDVLYVRLSKTDAEGKVGKEIRSTIQGALQSGIGKRSTADPFDAIDKGAALTVSCAVLARSLEKIFDRVDFVVEIIDKASSIHPYLSLAWQAVSCVYKAARNQQEVDERFVRLVQMIESIFDIICGTDLIRKQVKTLEGTICQFMQLSMDCCLFIQEYISHGFARRALAVTNDQTIQDFTGRFRDLRASLDSGVALHTSFVSSRMAEEVDIMYLLKELNPPDMNASNRKECLDGTRTELLEDIMGWFLSDTEENILWLRGVAGSGKSTISTTISGRCQMMRRRAAYLFFEREKSNPYSVIRALAASLARFHPSIGKHVSDAVRKHSEIFRDPLALQFAKLIYEPLRDAADSIQGPAIIILDALDECGTSDTREDLLSLIESQFAKLPASFRFLITSRPENDINRKLDSRSARIRRIDLDISSESSRVDVSQYISHEMRITLEKVDPKLPSGWDESMTLLSNAANGLFVWASTAIKMVSTSDDPFEDFENLLSYCRSTDGGSHQVAFGLESLYEIVLRNSGIRWDNDRSRSRFTQVLGLILLSKVPLPVAAIDGILGFKEMSSSRLIIQRLQSVLVYTPSNCGPTARAFHASFSDYLTNPKHSKDPWYIDVSARRRSIATQCFKVMQEGLRFNICDIESSYLRNEEVPCIEGCIKERISSSLDYACRFWSAHLCDVPQSDASHELINSLMTFVQQKLLYWMEVLSLKKRFWYVCSRALKDATSWSAEAPSNISCLLRDAHQFATTFAIPISKSVPHIYLSALSFQENTSTMQQHYSAGHPIIHIRTFGSKVPQSYIKIFEGHTSSVLSVAFSPDGKRIVSGSDDKTIRVWDAESGELVAGPFEGHTDAVSSVAFSPDGKRIVSGSWDKTIRVWDAESGELVAGPFEGHTDAVLSVAFSPDGKRVVSGSDDTIRVWDAESGELVAGPFEGHTDVVLSVAFSPDGKRIVSGSRDKTIRVWDAESGELVAGPFEGHTGEVLSVAFSPDGKRIVSGSWDKTIRVWEASDEPTIVQSPCEASSYRDSVRYCSDSMRRLLNELGISTSWITSHDGWLLGRNGEFLLWVPPDVRLTLWQPSSIAIFSCRFSTVLDFTHCRVGPGWHNGFPRP